VVKSEVKQLAAGQFNASLQFEVAPEQSGPIRDRLKQLGRVARLEIDRVQQATPGATVSKDAKVTRGDTVFIVQLYNLANIAPRETTLIQVAVPDVPAAYQTLRDAVTKVQGRVANAQLNEQDRRNVTAQLDFEVRRADEGTVQATLAAIGDTITRQVTRAPEGDNVTDSKVLYRVTLAAVTALVPRKTTTLAVEVQDVDAKAAQFTSWVSESQGRVLDSTTARERSGRVTARQVYEVPLAAADGLVEKMKAAGTVRVFNTTITPQATEGRYATARIDVTLATPEQIVAADAGLLDQLRRGLSVSLTFLLTSLTWLIFGLCVVLPWAVVGYLGYRVVRWLVRPRSAPVPASATTS
jgi:hypothetical protein